MENLNQTYHTRLQFPAGWFNGLVESILQMFHSCHSFPFTVLLYGQMHGKWSKTGPQGSRKYARACHMFCVLLAGLQIDLFLVFVADMALAVQTDKPRLAADEHGLTELVPGLSGWTGSVGCAAPQLMDTLCTSTQVWRQQRLPLYLSVEQRGSASP